MEALWATILFSGFALEVIIRLITTGSLSAAVLSGWLNRTMNPLNLVHSRWISWALWKQSWLQSFPFITQSPRRSDSRKIWLRFGVKTRPMRRFLSRTNGFIEGEENFVGDSEIIALGGASNETKDRPLG